MEFPVEISCVLQSKRKFWNIQELPVEPIYVKIHIVIFMTSPRRNHDVIHCQQLFSIRCVQCETLDIKACRKYRTVAFPFRLILPVPKICTMCQRLYPILEFLSFLTGEPYLTFSNHKTLTKLAQKGKISHYHSP